MPMAVGSEVNLPAHAAHHAGRVLRLRKDDEVVLFNGGGGEFVARLARLERSIVVASVVERIAIERESPLATTLVQGVASSDRMDFAIQKAIELGVSEIQPVTTARSVVHLTDERASVRLEHWRQMAIATCEQCGRNRLPAIHRVRSYPEWLANGPHAALRLLFVPEAGETLADIAPSASIELLIGPEGGFASDELQAAFSAGFRALHLGPRILRVETAGPAALAAMNALWGDAR